MTDVTPRPTSTIDTSGMNYTQARAVRHLADPCQMHLSPRHWGGHQ